MPSDPPEQVPATRKLRYCSEHKSPCDECPTCKTYSYCPECRKCYEPECPDS